MQTLLNFAHPLSEKATKQIEEEVGEFIKEVKVTCQLDLSGKSLDAQMADIEASTNIRLWKLTWSLPPHSLPARTYLRLGTWSAGRIVGPGWYG